MNKKSSKQTNQKPADRGHLPHTAGKTPLPEQATLADELARQGQLNGLPNHPTSDGMRQSIVMSLQRTHGNGHVSRYLAQGGAGPSVPSGLVQRQDEEAEGGGGGTNGVGSGSITGASEDPYDVSGATLPDLIAPLRHFGAHAAETRASITIDGQVVPQNREDGTKYIEVTWITTDMVVGLPRWTNYNDACAVAQQEWDRFMGQTRVHEQTAHVDEAEAFVSGLGEADTVIEGATVQELQDNLRAKATELQGRLQAIHDGCDHGVGIDAILHTERDTCERE